jgi:RHS repeat-associated protein
MTTKYQPNDANQYAKIAHGTEVVEPEYDPQGNLLHDATRQYTWDADIHLTSVTTEGHRETQRIEEPGTTGAAPRGATGPVASGQASGLPHVAPQNAPSKTTTTRFLYDPLHRRIARVKDSGEVTLYTYEGWNVVAEKTTSTAPQLDTENFKLETRHVWGEDLSGTLQGAGGIGGLLRSTIVEAKPNGTRQTEHEHTFSYDSTQGDWREPRETNRRFALQGETSVRRERVNCSGNIILLTGPKAQETARYSYDAFGKTLTASGPAAQTNRYQFSTKPVEEESGLVYYGYRWYDPVTGRWPSRDPIEERGGVNIYSAVSNEMINQTDLLGQTPTAFVGCVGGCLLGGIGGAIGGLFGSWTFRGMACGGVAGAANGCCSGAVCGAFPPFCIAGSCLCGFAASNIEQGCNGTLNLNSCSTVTAILSALAGCLGGAASLSDQGTHQLIAFLTGVDIGVASSLCTNE